jgi:hypothetical protein
VIDVDCNEEDKVLSEFNSRTQLLQSIGNLNDAFNMGFEPRETCENKSYRLKPIGREELKLLTRSTKGIAITQSNRL